MKAVTLSTFGSPEVMQITEVPIPTPGPFQLLVKVQAAGVNRADLLQCRGHYPPPPGESDILGLEIAGDVVDWGENVQGFQQGQRVFGLLGGGGYAEYCLLDSQMAMPMPENWQYIEAATVPEAYFAASETLFELAKLKNGESVLIHASSSGVGSAGVQMAHHVGAKVFVTASSQEKMNKAIALGAVAAVNYHQQAFDEVLLTLTKNEGVNVILDFIGSDYLHRNMMVLKPLGRLLQVAYMSGRQAKMDLQVLMRKRLTVYGFVMRSQSLEEKRGITKRFIHRWLPMLAAGEIKPVIDKVYPFCEVRRAHEHLYSRKHFGKVVLTFTES